MGLLELAQLAQEPVVLGVGDFGTVLEVVEAVVTVDFFDQEVDPPAIGCERVSGQASVSAGIFR